MKNHESQESKNGHGNHGVLIVDNSRVGWGRVRNLLDGICSSDEIWSAINPDEAFDKLERHRPGVLILDIDMPVSRGYVLMKEIRSAHPQLEIVVLTSVTSLYVRQLCREAGVDFFFDKATESQLIPEVVRRLLHGSQHPSIQPIPQLNKEQLL